ncbi:MAG TPA: hypothetical protein VEQ63_09510, partial [Bryobacteraceae bacterium]|nr:hypothetical protein [Bryobacteraceae bacterium]
LTPVLEDLVRVIGTIDSEHDRAELLSVVAEKYPDDARVREAVRKVADKISSDSDYRRVVSKLLANAGPQSSADRKD